MLASTAHPIIHDLWIAVACVTALGLIIASITVIRHPRGWGGLVSKTIIAVLVMAACAAAYVSSTIPHALAISNVIPAGGTVYHEESGATSQNPLGSGLPLALANSGTAGHVVFTFDDGPDVFTPAIINLLKELHIRGIFFDIGKKVSDSPQIVKAEVAAGDEVGNHTWNHHSLTGKGTNTKPLTLAQARAELSEASAAIKSATGHAPTLWRPPYGAVSPADAKLASSMGMRLVMDSSFDNSIVDSNDWSGISPEKIAAEVEHSLSTDAGTNAHDGKPGGTRIVAFHDGISTAPNTIEALPIIVQWMNAHHWMSTLKLPADTTGGWLTAQGQKAQQTSLGDHA